jgi:hypothetical protein
VDSKRTLTLSVKEGRENEPGEPNEARGRGFVGSGQVKRRELLHKAETESLGSGAEEDESGAESTMGKHIVDRKRRPLSGDRA